MWTLVMIRKRILNLVVVSNQFSCLLGPSLLNSLKMSFIEFLY